MKWVLNDGHRFFYLTKLSKMLKLFYAFVRFFHRVQTMLTIRGPFVAQVGGRLCDKKKEEQWVCLQMVRKRVVPLGGWLLSVRGAHISRCALIRVTE